MPRKIRELVRDYKKAGFILNEGGKGSHRKFVHHAGIVKILSGSDGEDAKPYQERDLREALALAAQGAQ